MVICYNCPRKLIQMATSIWNGYEQKSLSHKEANNLPIRCRSPNYKGTWKTKICRHWQRSREGVWNVHRTRAEGLGETPLLRVREASRKPEVVQKVKRGRGWLAIDLVKHQWIRGSLPTKRCQILKNLSHQHQEREPVRNVKNLKPPCLTPYPYLPANSCLGKPNIQM